MKIKLDTSTTSRTDSGKMINIDFTSLDENV